MEKRRVAEAVAALEESGMSLVESEEFEQGRPTLLESDPYMFTMQDYDHFQEDLYGAVPKWARGRVTEPVRTETKIGNNELCPCGSGKKYKKCCK